MSYQGLIRKLEKHYGTDKPSIQRVLAKVLELPVKKIQDIYPIQETEEQILVRYHYRGHDDDDICKKFHMKVYDLNDRNRPVPPSEGRGFTNTHPNCKCWWESLKTSKQKVGQMDRTMSDHVQGVHRKIGQRSRHGTLHKVKVDGTLSQKTMKRNPLRVTLMGLREEFVWISPEYMQALQTVPVEGSWLLIRVAGESITDHRSEGEQYRRWLKDTELAQLTRTGIGKGADINHNPEFRTGAKVMDGEFDFDRKESQFVVLENDPEIIAAITSQTITAVSINAGPPRSELITCPACEMETCECFMIPQGLILGELDDIAYTYVVTNPSGMMWKGQMIAPATPGIKTTSIEIIS